MECPEVTLPVTSASNHEIRRHQVGIQLAATHMVKYIFNVLLTAVRNLGRWGYDLYDQNLGTNNLPGAMLMTNWSLVWIRLVAPYFIILLGNK